MTPPAAAIPSRLALVGIVLGLALPVAALAYGLWAVYLAWRVPSATEYAAATAHVRTHAAHGDCVVFAPAWAHEAAPLLGENGVPAGPFRVLLGETHDVYELTRCARVWVLASLSGRSPTPFDGFREIARANFGRMDVHLWRPPDRGRVTYDFLAEIAAARVRHVFADHADDCRIFQDDRWYCGRVHPWQFVGQRLRDIAGLVRPVIWAHPLNRNDRLEITYPAVPIGTRLDVRFGLTQRAIEHGGGSPVHLEVRVGDEVAFTRALASNEEGFFLESIPTLPQRGVTAPVTFTIWTQDFALREFCFTAYVWDDATN